MLSHLKLPLSYWSYAISAATHIINRLSIPLLHNKSPWEILVNFKPDLLHLRVFGCTCFPLLRPYNKHKLQPHTTPCIFLGYPAYSKGYICLDPQTLRIYISRHVLFNESEFFSFQSPSLPTGSSLDTSSPSSVAHWLSFLSHFSADTLSQAVVNSEVSPTAHVSSLAPTPSLPHTLPTSPPLVSESLPSSSHSPSSSSLLTPPLVESLPSPTVPSVLVVVPAQNIHPMITRSKDGIFKPKALVVPVSKPKLKNAWR